MSAAWRSLPFEDVIADESGGNLKTPQSEYALVGRFPVIDQGKRFIAGYVDDESRVCRSQLPAIVFGDHTRCFKFIDFPFCMGADGVKVLRPKIEADVKYLFRCLQQVSLPNGGYDRHFKYLRRSDLLLPPLPEQRRIAAVLDRAEALRARRAAAIATLDQLAQALFIEQFGDPVENPKGLPLRTLLELVDKERPITYGILMPGPDQAVGVKYVRVLDMKDGEIDSNSARKTTQKISDVYRRSLLKAGDLLLSIRGHVGRVALVPRDLEGANITQDTARLAVSAPAPVFIRECLRTPGIQGWMARHTKGVAVRGLNLGDLKRLTIPVPPRPQQESFARRIAAIDEIRVVQRASLKKFDALFASLQHHAFRGEL